MSHTCPTVRIKCPTSEHNDQGFVVINETDFDSATMELFDVPVVTTVVEPTKTEVEAGTVVIPSWAK